MFHRGLFLSLLVRLPPPELLSSACFVVLTRQPPRATARVRAALALSPPVGVCRVAFSPPPSAPSLPFLCVTSHPPGAVGRGCRCCASRPLLPTHMPLYCARSLPRLSHAAQHARPSVAPPVAPPCLFHSPFSPPPLLSPLFSSLFFTYTAIRKGTARCASGSAGRPPAPLHGTASSSSLSCCLLGAGAARRSSIRPRLHSCSPRHCRCRLLLDIVSALPSSLRLEARSFEGAPSGRAVGWKEGRPGARVRRRRSVGCR